MATPTPTAAIGFTRRKVIDSIAALLSGSAIAQGMTALALLLTARQLGASDYGRYAACFTLTSLSGVLFNLGLDIWLLREGGRAPDQLGKLIGGVLSIKASIGVIWLCLIAGLTLVLPHYTFPPGLLLWCALSTFLDNLLSATLTAFKSVLKNRISSLLEAGSDILWFLFTVLLILSGNRQAINFVQVRVVILFFSLAVGIFLTLRFFKPERELTTIRRALKETPSYASSELLSGMSMRADVLIISLFIGRYAVGLYSPAEGLINALFLIPASVHMVMVPVLSNQYANNQPQAKKSARRMILLLFFVGIALFLAFLVGAPLLANLLGPSYQASIGVMQILSLILLLKSLSYAMAAILLATGQQARRSQVQAVAVALNVVLNILIVQGFGISGVAVVYVTTETVLLLGYTWLVLRSRDVTLAAGGA